MLLYTVTMKELLQFSPLAHQMEKHEPLAICALITVTVQSNVFILFPLLLYEFLKYRAIDNDNILSELHTDWVSEVSDAEMNEAETGH